MRGVSGPDGQTGGYQQAFGCWLGLISPLISLTKEGLVFALHCWSRSRWWCLIRHLVLKNVLLDQSWYIGADRFFFC